MAELRPVEAQIEAYNARDVDRFLASYAPDVVVQDGAGNKLSSVVRLASSGDQPVHPLRHACVRRPVARHKTTDPGSEQDIALPSDTGIGMRLVTEHRPHG